MSIEEIENLLGRNLKLTEGMIYEMFKTNIEYSFRKDESGNLEAYKIESI